MAWVFVDEDCYNVSVEKTYLERYSCNPAPSKISELLLTRALASADP